MFWGLGVLILLIIGIGIFIIIKNQSEIYELKKQLSDFKEPYMMQVFYKRPTNLEWVAKSDKVPKFSELKDMTFQEFEDFTSKLATEGTLIEEKLSKAVKALNDAESELTRDAMSKTIADKILVENQHRLKPLKETEQSLLKEQAILILTSYKTNLIFSYKLASETDDPNSNHPMSLRNIKFIFTD